MSNLPKGWVMATISDLIGDDGVFNDGDWVESKDQDPEGNVRLVQLADVGDGEYRDRSSRFLTFEKAEELRCRFMEKGDIMVARMPGPLGRACLFPGDQKKAVTVVDVCIVRPGEESADPRWLMHQINAPQFRWMVSSYQTGTTRKRISRKNLAKIEFPVPPLSEQRRIVARIEGIFSRLDAGVTALRHAKGQLQRYRQSVLAAAITGQFTQTWREQHPNTEPASELLVRILEERREQWNGKGNYKEPKSSDPPHDLSVPDSWQWTNLSQLKSFSIYGPRFSSNDYAENGVLVLRTSDISEVGKVNSATAPKLQLPETEFEKYKCEKGDLLITRTGSLGTLAVYNDDSQAIPGAYLILYRPALPDPLCWFLFHFLKSPIGQSRLTGGGQGSGRQNLNASAIESIPIPLPPLAEQHQIVAEVEARTTAIDRLEAELDYQINRSNRLRQSTLSKGFSGNLVPQDPTDEPASILLETIAKNKTTKPKEKRRRTQSTINSKPKKITTMRSLIQVLSSHNDWITAQQAFAEAGVANGSDTDAVEKIYEDLHQCLDRIDVQRRGHEDWLRLNSNSKKY